MQVEALGDIHAEGRVFSSVLKGGRTATRLGMMGGDLKKYLLDQSFPNVPDDIIDLDY